MTSYNHSLEKNRYETMVAHKDIFGRGRSSEWAAAGCQIESCSEILRVPGEGDGVERRNSGSIAYRAMSGRSALR